MFSVFTKVNGSKLIIRAVDLRRLEDGLDATEIAWDECGESITSYIQGSAQENLDRLKAEETEALIAAEKLRQRQAQGLPAEPVQRGRQTMRMVAK